MPATVCQVCGRLPATYVCQGCGRQTCGNCLDQFTWLCIDCRKKSEAPSALAPVMSGSKFSWATWLFIGALLIIIVGTVLVLLGSMSSPGGSVAFVFLLGPFPIVVGSGPEAFPLIVMAGILTAISLLSMFFLMRRR